MKKCEQCGVMVKNLRKHKERNRCEAQHIRGREKPSRGKRGYHK